MTNKDMALERMNKELEVEHSSPIDEIHNLICDQDDDELFVGVMKEGKTLAGAFKYLVEKARKMQQQGVAVMTQSDVLVLSKEYFTTDIFEAPPAPKHERVNVSVVQKQQRPDIKKEPVVVKPKEPTMLNIFDFIEEYPDEEEDEENVDDND